MDEKLQKPYFGKHDLLEVIRDLGIQNCSPKARVAMNERKDCWSSVR